VQKLGRNSPVEAELQVEDSAVGVGPVGLGVQLVPLHRAVQLGDNIIFTADVRLQAQLALLQDLVQAVLETRLVGGPHRCLRCTHRTSP
jgi:hypothetical protein